MILDPKYAVKNQLFVFLMSDLGTLYSLHLPEKTEGRYKFERRKGSEDLSFLYFEQIDGIWNAFSSKSACMISSAGEKESVRPLLGSELIEVRRHSHVYFLYIEPGNGRSNVFHPYLMNKDVDVVIGREHVCDILYPNPLVSRYEARLKWKGTCWNIQDEGSRNGIYCNGKRIVGNRNLLLGDVVFILGLRIVIGAGFISINDANDRISVNPKALHSITQERYAEKHFFASPPPRAKSREPFSCSPRKRVSMTPKDIVLEAPPVSMDGQKMPLMLRMGSSMVMSGSAALAGNYVMLLSSVFFPLLSQRFTEKERKAYEEKRQTRYGEYLNEKSSEITREKDHEEYVLRRNYPEFSKVLSYSTSKREHLWERRKNDDDFMQVRMGSGKMPLMGKVDYPDQRFNLERDELEEQMYSLAETPVILENIPILFDFVKYNINGILGDRDRVISFLKQLLLRICLIHSYDEVKLVFLGEETHQEELSFVRFLPHVWDNERSIRFLASEISEAGQIGEYLKSELSQDLEKRQDLSEILKRHPYYVICVTSKKLFDSVEALKDIMSVEYNCGVTVLAVFNDLPKECSVQINITKNETNTITYLRDLERGEEHFVMDSYDPVAFKRCVKSLANTELRLLNEAFSLPKSVSLLEMFNVGRVEHLNPLKRWQESNPVLSLAVPVGVSTDGSLFILDLHQKVHGPHGLVAGMTGSGKSEFLLTYIVSLAVNYHPDEVAFVLIDYKGGGLAGAFDDPERDIHLPHLIATITNLDGSTIQRSLLSIQSELTRRQKVFNEVKSLSNEGTVDIYKYQRMYREKRVSEPMPHLFIICDEFAELKQQQPEFMDQLISIARIGRSLGVHLILATQKPSGVVNDQIRSNSKFRVCLKVQDKSDSMDLLMRPEAAGLKETGRFYMQVGYNEQFSLGQSAWSGAPYQPLDAVVSQKDESVQFLDSTGQSLLAISPEKKKESAQGSQLLAVVQLLSRTAREQGIKPRSLWKPALPELLDSAKLEAILPEKDKHLRVCIGVLDDPINQRQLPLIYDFNKSNNLLIVGGPGCGKSTLVHSILRSLLRRFTPEQFQFYALDFSGRLLKMYSHIPHCGGVLVEEESDSFERFFDMLQTTVSERKRLFSKMELDDYDTVNSIHPLPLILVIIDNLSGMTASKVGENIGYKLPAFLKDGLPYGVKYILTDGNYNSVSSRIRREMGDVLPLHLKDKYEYSEALNCRTEIVPRDIPGRGMYAWEGHALELQVAMDNPMEDEKTRSEITKGELAEITEKFVSRSTARRLPVIDPTAEYIDFAAQFRPGRIPLGFSVSDNKPVALPLKQFSVLSVFCGNARGVVPLTENFLHAIQRENGLLYIVRRKQESVFKEGAIKSVAEGLFRNAVVIDSSAQEISALWQSLEEKEISPRRELHNSFCREKGLDPDLRENARSSFAVMQEKTRPLFILFENFADVCSEADMISRLIFGRFTTLFESLNSYMICFYEPDDGKDLVGNSLYHGFNADGPCMLFGGRYGHQQLCDVYSSQDPDSELPYNICLMRYKRNIYPILTPCGQIAESETEDEDDRSIF